MFYDEYVAHPVLLCPLCGRPIESWEGRDGPRKLLLWRQGTSEPSDVEGTDLDDALLAHRLPEEFRLRTTCSCSGRLVEAMGRCVSDTWTSTRLLPLRPSVDDSLETMCELIEEELADIRDTTVLEAVRKGLVEPELHQREWDYSSDHVFYPCWWVARFPKIKQALVYSEHGHAYTWGIVDLESNWFGKDDGWYGSLEEAFRLLIGP